MKFCFPIEKKSVDEHQPFQPKMKSKLFSNKMLYCIKGCAKRFSYELFSFFNSYVYIRHLFFNGQKLINNPISWHSSIFYSWNIVNTKGMNNKHEQENNPPIIGLKKKVSTINTLSNLCSFYEKQKSFLGEVALKEKQHFFS